MGMYLGNPSPHTDTSGGRLVISATDDRHVAVDAKHASGGLLWMYTYDLDEAKRLRDALSQAIETAEQGE